MRARACLLSRAMGRKAEAKEDKKVEEEVPEVEDPPIVKALKGLDDKYLEIEREYEREVQKLQRLFSERQATFLQQRAEVLSAPNRPCPQKTASWARRR